MKNVKEIFGIKEQSKKELKTPDRQSIEQTEDYATKKVIRTKEFTLSDGTAAGFLKNDAKGKVTGGNSGGGSPSGNSGDVQINNNGSFYGTDNIKYNLVANALVISGHLIVDNTRLFTVGTSFEIDDYTPLIYCYAPILMSNGNYINLGNNFVLDDTAFTFQCEYAATFDNRIIQAAGFNLEMGLSSGIPIDAATTGIWINDIYDISCASGQWANAAMECNMYWNGSGMSQWNTAYPGWRFELTGGQSDRFQIVRLPASDIEPPTDPYFNLMFYINGNTTWGIRGKNVKYRNIVTVSNGIPSEYATVDLTTQSAIINTTTLYAVPADGAGMYRISYTAKVTRAATTSSTLGALTIGYTDADATTPAIVSATNTGNTTTSLIQGVVIVYAKASTNITYAMGYVSSGATTMQYNLHIKVEAL